MKTLDDTTAIYILKTIARTQLTSPPAESHLTPELSGLLATTFADSPPTTASEGDLARAALDLLSENPKFAEPILLMASQPGNLDRPDRYIDPASIALTTAVLLALQTRIKFKAEQGGKWSVEVDKKAGSDAAVKLVVQRLLSFLGK